jgi:hypothetical protein
VLRTLKLRSLRQGVWYRAVSRLERAEVDLTLRFVRRVRSPFLARVLNMIIDKLFDALESRVSRVTWSIGFPLAMKFSRIAQSWGNRSAELWARDAGFARFLAVMNINDPALG